MSRSLNLYIFVWLSKSIKSLKFVANARWYWLEIIFNSCRSSCNNKYLFIDFGCDSWLRNMHYAGCTLHSAHSPYKYNACILHGCIRFRWFQLLMLQYMFDMHLCSNPFIPQYLIRSLLKCVINIFRCNIIGEEQFVALRGAKHRDHMIIFVGFWKYLTLLAKI